MHVFSNFSQKCAQYCSLKKDRNIEFQYTILGIGCTLRNKKERFASTCYKTLMKNLQWSEFTAVLWIWIRIRHYLYGSGYGSFHQQAKKYDNPWLPVFYYFCPLFDFLSLKTDVDGILSDTDEKSRIQIRNSGVRIRGSGSVTKCHGP